MEASETIERKRSLMYEAPVCRIFVNYHDPNTVARDEAEKAIIAASRANEEEAEQKDEALPQKQSPVKEIIRRFSRSEGRRGVRFAVRPPPLRSISTGTQSFVTSDFSIASAPISSVHNEKPGTSIRRSQSACCEKFRRIPSTEDESDDEPDPSQQRFAVTIVDPIPDEDETIEIASEQFADLRVEDEEGKEGGLDISFASPIHLEFREVGAKRSDGVVEPAQFVSIHDINAFVLSSFLKKARIPTEKERKLRRLSWGARKKTSCSSLNSFGASSRSSSSSYASFDSK